MMAPLDKEAAVQRERERQKTINAYHRVFANKDGLSVIEDLKRQFGTESQAFLPGYDYSPVVAALRDGQRGVVLHIEAMLKRPPMADGNIETPKRKVKK